MSFHFPFPLRSFVTSRRGGQSSSEYKIQLKHFMLALFSPWVNSCPTCTIATWEALLVSVHDGFDVAEKQKNKTHFNCAVTWKPQTLLVGHLDQWISRALKAWENICLGQCNIWGLALVHERKPVMIQGEGQAKTHIQTRSQTSPQVEITVYEKEPYVWIRCKFKKKLFIIWYKDILCKRLLGLWNLYIMNKALKIQ